MLDPVTERTAAKAKADKLSEQGRAGLVIFFMCLVIIVFIQGGAVWGFATVAAMCFLNVLCCIWEANKLKK